MRDNTTLLKDNGFKVVQYGSLLLGSKRVGRQGHQVTIRPDGQVSGMIVGGGSPRKMTTDELRQTLGL
jgi:hypothetical protein